MAITFQYGPVGAAVNAASRAGAGDRQKALFDQGLSFDQLINQEQDAIDRRNANAVSQALGVDEFNTRTGQQDREFQAQQQQQTLTNQLRQQDDQSRDQELAANRAIAQQNANTATKNADTNSTYRTGNLDLRTTAATDKTNALDALPPDQAAMIRANGHLPAAQNQNSTSALAQQYRLLLDEARRVQKDKDAATYNENDIRQMTSGAGPSGSVPGAIAGMEDRFKNSDARLQAITARIKQTETALQNPSANLAGGTVDPNLGKQLVQSQQPAQQQAPQQQGQPPVVSSMQQYAALPPGTVYINARTGLRSVKN